MAYDARELREEIAEIFSGDREAALYEARVWSMLREREQRRQARRLDHASRRKRQKLHWRRYYAERALRQPLPPIPPLPRLFVCGCCGDRFVTEHAMRTHQRMRCAVAMRLDRTG